MQADGKKTEGIQSFGRRAAGALGRSLLVILLVTVAVFFLIRLVPGDPAVMVLGEHATDASLEALREKMGLNLSLPQQFLRFLQNLLRHGDTGESLKYGISCRELVLSRAPLTMALAGLGTLITWCVTLPLAFAAASRKNSVLDHLIRIVPAFTQGMPAFWTGLLLLLLLAVRLHLFPAGGLRPGILGGLHSLLLPAVTVSFGQIPPLVRSLRERLAEVLSEDFVTALRAAGVPRRSILLGHVLRNAAVPALMLFSVNFSYLIGGTLVIEQVFGLRGIGKLLFEAIANRDFPLVQAIALYGAILVTLISLLTEWIAGRIDPRTEA